MITPQVSSWTAVGESLNSDYYLVAPGILAAVPRRGSIDDEASARDNVRFQNAYFERTGAGVIVVYFDMMTSQDAGARKVYQTLPDPRYMLGTALIGGTLLSRAMGSFFLGLSKPSIPLKMFGSLEEAMQWAEGLKLARQRAEEGKLT